MFAAERHRNQRRKDLDASPYINHPIALAQLLADVGSLFLRTQCGGIPGIYNLSLVHGYCFAESGQTWPIDRGAALRIEVRKNK